MADDRPEYYTVAEVAEVARLTTWSVRRLIQENTFPNATRPGKSWLIPASDLADYLQNKHGRREDV